MRMLSIGKTGIKISVIGFGAWAIGGWMWGGAEQKQSLRAIDAALASGINLIDTAPAYGKGLSEKIVGKAIKNKRDQVVIATKCGLVWHVHKGVHFFDYPSGEKVHKYLGPESIRYEVEQSLSRMGIEYIDLYQTHWQDETTPIEETMDTLMNLKKEGKIRAIGASNATPAQLKQYQHAGQLDADQEKYSFIDTDIETVLPWCRKNHVTMLAYSPLGQGLLTGKLSPEREFEGDDLRRGNPRFSVQNRKKIQAVLAKQVEPIAQKYDLTIAQLSVAALVSQEGVAGLCGARNQSQAEENAKAGEVVIEKEDVQNIKSALGSLDL